MLEYVKFILEKVSFDSSLFEKELRKNLKELIGDEYLDLKAWCFEQFGKKHQDVLMRCFVA
jgi:hypothetical protein